MFPDIHWIDNSIRFGNIEDRELGITRLDESTEHAVRIDALFQQRDVQFLYRLHVCLQEIDKHRYLNRSFYGPQGENVPGNVVMYLSGILEDFAPSLYHKIVKSSDMAVRLNKWIKLDVRPSLLGVRCIEIISYDASTKPTPGLGGHTDTGSVYTMIAMLSNETDFVGGRLMVGNRGDFFDLGFGNAVLFHSEILHAVTPVIQGKRNVFSIEFWKEPTASWGSMRPIPQSVADKLGVDDTTNLGQHYSVI